VLIFVSIRYRWDLPEFRGIVREETGCIISKSSTFVHTQKPLPLKVLGSARSARAFAVLLQARSSSNLAKYDEIDPGSHGLASAVDIRTLTTALSLNSAVCTGRNFPKETDMRKLMTILFALSLLSSFSLVAQDTMKQDNMKSDTSAKAASIAGKISDDGKTFVSDKDGKSWTISNPEAVKGHEGHHVILKAHVSADTGSVDVVSLKMAGDKMKKDTSQN
jgi:hypothetical protein